MLNDYLAKLQDTFFWQLLGEKNLRAKYQQNDMIGLLEVAEQGLHSASEIYMLYRNLLRELYDMIPSLPGRTDIYWDPSQHFSISIEMLKQFDYPVFKISCPFLLPNKRRKNKDFKNAVTESVVDTVRRFCDKNGIQLIDKATIIYVSYHDDNPVTLVDNDNKESSAICNGIIGYLIRDDQPLVCNSVYYTKQISKGAWTEIYVVDSDHDIEVFSMIKAIQCENP